MKPSTEVSGDALGVPGASCSPISHGALGSPAHGVRPGLMFLTSPNGGLGHYVVHLWESVSAFAQPIYVTYRSPPVDDLVQARIVDIGALLDPEDPSSVGAVVRLARRRGVRFVNLHSGTRTKSNGRYFSALLRELRGWGIRSILHLHDAGVHGTCARDWHAVRQLCQVSDAVLVGSRREMDSVRRFPGVEPSRVALMHHGPYAMMDSGQLGRGEARRLLGLGTDEPVILCFGFLRGEKRVEDLVRAFALVKRRLSSAALLMQTHLAHAPDRRRWIEAQAQCPGLRVDTGYAPMHRVEALFKAADVVALPYDTVATSGVLNLARAFARPVVVTDRFEHAHRIHGTCGYQVSARDPQALAAALIRLLEMPVWKRRHFAEGWSRILETETWVNAAEALRHACRRSAAPEGTGVSGSRDGR